MDIKGNITRYTNLEENDSLSGFKDNVAQQSHNVYEIFYNFLLKVKPKRILEIGTALGGFTNFLKLVIDEHKLETKIWSFDVHFRDWYKEMNENGIEVRVENIFSDDYKIVKQDVIDFINNEGVSIVLCDGGNKIKEFNLLSKYLKKGDFIMAHDYSISKDFYEKEIFGKIWNWCEITEDDIKDICLDNNLTSYENEIFAKCVWVCKQKVI